MLIYEELIRLYAYMLICLHEELVCLYAGVRVASNHSQLGLLDPSSDGWNFAALCRGEELRAELPHVLKCRHEVRGGHPRLRLGPAQLEEVHRQPDITMYHNVITDRELDNIRNTAKPKVSQCAL